KPLAFRLTKEPAVVYWLMSRPAADGRKGSSSPKAALNSIRSTGLYFNWDQPPTLFNGSTVDGFAALKNTLPVTPAPRPPSARPRYSSPDSEKPLPSVKSQSPVTAHASTVRP